MDEKRKKALEELETASPLEMTSLLQELELYDKESSQKVIDDVYEQFASGDNMQEEILVPVFSAVIDGLLEATGAGRKARKKGLTASRVIQECKQFSYDRDNENGTSVNAFTEFKNANHDSLEYKVERTSWERRHKEDKPEYSDGVAQWENKHSDDLPQYKGTVNSKMTQKYNKDTRKKYEDKEAMDGYKDRQTEGHSTVKDEYTGKSDLYDQKRNRPNNATDTKNAKLAETDHIVPLKQIHDEFKYNYALDDNDIKMIANADYNFATTAAEINDGRGKGALSNEEYIKKMEANGTPLDKETADNMRRLQKEAEKAIDKQANSLIAHNLVGKIDKKAIDAKYDAMKDSKIKAFEKKHGRKPDENELANIQNQVDKRKSDEIEKAKSSQKEKAKEIGKNNAEKAAKQAADYAVGNVILFIVKPIYYEISDIFKNGMKEGVGVSSTGEALKIRFGRIKKHVLKHAGEFIGDNIGEFIKGFISSLVECIISLFVGVFKQVLKLIKEGIKIFVQSAKILFGKESSQMTAAQKGDAIIKLIGGSVIAIAGIGIEALLNKIGIGEPWSVVLSTMLSGIVSALFMYLLDKADIFSVKAEKRHDRIIEIFNERINDIEEATNTMNTVALDALKRQRFEFEHISEKINAGLDSDNIMSINEGLYDMAKFMDVDLEYSNTEEFCDYMDSNALIML